MWNKFSDTLPYLDDKIIIRYSDGTEDTIIWHPIMNRAVMWDQEPFPTFWKLKEE